MLLPLQRRPCAQVRWPGVLFVASFVALSAARIAP